MRGLPLLLLLLLLLDSGFTDVLREGACEGEHAAACTREGKRSEGWVPGGDEKIGYWQADVSAWYSEAMAALELVNRRGWEAVSCAHLLPASVFAFPLTVLLLLRTPVGRR